MMAAKKSVPPTIDHNRLLPTKFRSILAKPPTKASESPMLSVVPTSPPPTKPFQLRGSRVTSRLASRRSSDPWNDAKLKLLEELVNDTKIKFNDQRWVDIASTLNEKFHRKHEVFRFEDCRSRWSLIARARHLQRLDQWLADNEGRHVPVPPGVKVNSEMCKFILGWGSTLHHQETSFVPWSQCAALIKKRSDLIRTEGFCHALWVRLRPVVGSPVTKKKSPRAVKLTAEQHSNLTSGWPVLLHVNQSQNLLMTPQIEKPTRMELIEVKKAPKKKGQLLYSQILPLSDVKSKGVSKMLALPNDLLEKLRLQAPSSVARACQIPGRSASKLNMSDEERQYLTDMLETDRADGNTFTVETYRRMLINTFKKPRSCATVRQVIREIEAQTKPGPATSIPATSVPATSVPATSVPATSFPTTSFPATSVPATSFPATSFPAGEIPSKDGGTLGKTPSLKLVIRTIGTSERVPMNISTKNDTNEWLSAETGCLYELVDSCVGVPGWGVVAEKLNAQFESKRTAEDVRDRYLKVIQKPLAQVEKEKSLLKLSSRKVAGLRKLTRDEGEGVVDFSRVAEKMFTSYGTIISPEMCDNIIKGMDIIYKQRQQQSASDGPTTNKVARVATLSVARGRTTAGVESERKDSSNKRRPVLLRNILESPEVRVKTSKFGRPLKRKYDVSDYVTAADDVDVTWTPRGRSGGKRSKTSEATTATVSPANAGLTTLEMDESSEEDDDGERPPSPTVSFYRHEDQHLFFGESVENNVIIAVESSALHAAMESAVDAESQIAVSEDEVAGPGDEVTELRDEVVGPGDEVTELRDEVAGPGDEVAELRDEVTELRDEIVGLGDEVTELGDEVAELGDEATELGDGVIEPGNEVVELGDGITEPGDEVEDEDDDLMTREEYTDGMDMTQVNLRTTERRYHAAQRKRASLDLVTGQFKSDPDYDPVFDWEIRLPGDACRNVLQLWIPIFKCLLEIESSNLLTKAFVQIPENTVNCVASGRLVRIVGAEKACVKMPIELGQLKRDLSATNSMRKLPLLRAVWERARFRIFRHSDSSVGTATRHVCLELAIPGKLSTGSVCIQTPNCGCLLLVESRNLLRPVFVNLTRMDGYTSQRHGLLEFKGVEKVSVIIPDEEAITVSDHVLKESHINILKNLNPSIRSLNNLRSLGKCQYTKHSEPIEEETNTDDRIVSCRVCGERFSSEVGLKEHEEIDEGKCGDPDKLKLICRQCSTVYTDKALFYKHLNTEHLSVKMGRCKVCGEVRSQASMSMHIDEHFPEECGRLCPLCGFNGMDQAVRRGHLNFHASVRPWKCEYCSIRFDRRRALLKHRLTHALTRQKCTICSYTTKSPRTLQDHIKFSHEGLRMTCDICSRTFPTKLTFRLHKVGHKAGLACNVCGNAYKRAEQLRMHLERVGAGVEPCIRGEGANFGSGDVKRGVVKQVELKCPCPKVFDSVDELTMHVNSLHQAEQYCELCGRFYAHQSALCKHKKLVHDQAACRRCNLVFQSAADFTRHWRNVHKDREHRCQHCGHLAGSKKKLSRHRVEVHGVPSSSSKYSKPAVVTEVAVPTIFKCIKCNLSFADEGQLQSHVLQDSLDDMASYNETIRSQNIEETFSENEIVGSVVVLTDEANSVLYEELADDSQTTEVLTPASVPAEETGIQSSTKDSRASDDSSERGKRLHVTEINRTFIRVESEQENHYIEVSEELKKVVGTDGQVDIPNLTQCLQLEDGTLLQMSEASHRSLSTCEEVRAQEVSSNTLIVTAVHTKETFTPPKKNTTAIVDPRTSCDICGKILSTAFGRNSHRHFSHPFPNLSKEVYPCSMCDKRYMLKEYRDEHYRHFHSSLKCDLCPLLFSDEEVRSAHVCLGPRRPEPLDCKICHKKKCYKNIDALMEHIRKDHPECGHVCEFCGYSAKSTAVLTAHKKHQHRQPERYECPRCGAKFARGNPFRSHILLHVDPQLWLCVCEFCRRRFVANDTLKKHIKSVHHDLGLINCQECDLQCPTPEKLKEHMREEHEVDTSVKCIRCTETVADEVELEKHWKTCKGTLYKCEFCGQGFVEYDDILQAHIMTHYSRTGGYDQKIKDLQRQNSSVPAVLSQSHQHSPETTTLSSLVANGSKSPPSKDGEPPRQIVQLSGEDLTALRVMGIDLVVTNEKKNG